ncbi:MAG: hypothetical protein PHH54_01115 [Candidatus Nanoarchaeia archaeon]|nr:hypothetical protein [Candidatus Nanoarchaeia archaeon]MDD5740564.1 hypothetical protein [Candidatus Nanoarchaeia archaeon]
MTGKIRVFLILNILLSLIILSVFVEIVSAADFNIPIYIQTSAGTEKASSKIIKEVLIEYNFEVQKTYGYVTDDKCSVSAGGDNLDIDEMSLGNIDLGFYIPLPNGGLGGGRLTAREGRYNIFNLDFEITEILETNAQTLKFKAVGDGALNQDKLSFYDIIATFDKENNKVDIIGKGDMDFEAKDIEANKVTWCGEKETDFYLITTKNRLNEQRSVEEIRGILDEHPELIDAYEGLREFYKPEYYTPVIIPEFSTFAGVLTLTGAVCVFFVIRRK